METTIQKQLLQEYMVFKATPQQLRESIEKNNGALIVEGIIQKAEAKNGNGRIYPKSILEEAINRYKENFINNGNSYLELDHPNSEVVALSNSCGVLKEVWWNGNDVMGKIEVLSDIPNGSKGTPTGNILKTLFERGLTVGISSRAMGSVKQIDENTVEVQDDLEFASWDFVSNPSTPGANMKPSLNEGKISKIKTKYSKINEIITDIFTL